MKPLIGITGSSYKYKFTFLFLKLAVFTAGGRVLKLDASKDKNYKKCSAFIISGGSDINPKLYNAKNTTSYDIDDKRDELEKNIANYALENNKPLLGICRGAQMINIVRGGNLYQHACDFHQAFVPTDSLLGKIFIRRIIKLEENSKIFKIFQRRRIKVNSLHHQAINKLGKNLKITAEDITGIVQAVEDINKSKFILGVQWHPEFMLYNKYNRKIFKKLILAAIKTN